MARLRMRMAAVLTEEGAPHADVAASALAVRGSLGLDRSCFAALFDVDENVVAALEAGLLSLGEAPASLHSLLTER